MCVLRAEGNMCQQLGGTEGFNYLTTYLAINCTVKAIVIIYNQQVTGLKIGALGFTIHFKHGLKK